MNNQPPQFNDRENYSNAQAGQPQPAPNYGGHGQFNSPFTRLPADPGAMTLGIIGVIITVLSCCCGVTAPISIILNAIGLSKANKSLKLYEANPSIYNQVTYKNVNNAKTLNLVSLILSSLLTVFIIIYLAFFGFIMLDQFRNEFNRGFNESNNSSYDDNYYDENADEDTVYPYEDYEQIDEMEDNQNVEQLDPVTIESTPSPKDN